MSTHVPASGEPVDPEEALGRLDVAVASMGTRGAAPASAAQAARRLAILAGEVRADDPLPEIAHAAGAGLGWLAGPWSDLAPQVTADVGVLLDWVDRRASEAASRAAGEAATAAAKAPVRRGPRRGIDLGPTPDDGDAWGEDGDVRGGPDGIGAPILPKGRR